MSQGSTLVDIYRAEGVRRVKIGFTDIDGVMRGKYRVLISLRRSPMARRGFVIVSSVGM